MVIDLPEGPVRWINVIKKDPSKESPPMWWINFCIPDERPISGNREIDVKTVRKKTFPLFGQVIGVDWKGKDHSTGLVNRLSYDQSAKDLANRIRQHQDSKLFKGIPGVDCAGDRKVRAYPPGLANHSEDRRLSPVGSPRLTVPTTNVPEEKFARRTLSSVPVGSGDTNDSDSSQIPMCRGVSCGRPRGPRSTARRLKCGALYMRQNDNLSPTSRPSITRR